MALKAKVQDGRLKLDEPTDLPEGTVVELEEIDPYRQLDHGDPFADMTSEERERLHASLDRGLAEARAGLGRPASEFVAELRARRR